MANVITISDSDSEDLPSFAERVQKLIQKEDKRNKSPKRSVTQVHPISESDSDSRETIPLTRSDSKETIPLIRSDSREKIHLMRSDFSATTLFTRDRSLSPVYSFLDSQKHDSSQKNGSVSSSSDTLDLNPRSVSPISSLPDLNQNSESPPWSLPDLPDHFLSQKDESFNSDGGICVMKLKKHKEKRSDKEIEKEEKKKIRLEKKKEKDLMKALKVSEKEILKHQKPEECLKNMKVVVDHKILSLEGGQSLLNSLHESNLNCTVEENKCKYSVIWYRKVINICTENHEVVREEREELADTVLLVIPNENFLKMVHSYVQNSKGRSCENLSLEEFIVSVKSLFSNCCITCITIGFERYLRNIKEEGNFEMKSMVKQIHKNAPEEAVIQLQLQSSINFNFLETMHSFVTLIQQFTKAIAEAPRRKEKENQKSLAFSWYADIDSHCPIKLSKDGSSFIKLWRQQIQQFQNVGPEVADAIVSHYSSPRALLKAYKRCPTTKDAENLLQDIVVRRNYGPLGTQKRIGPELSFKFHLFFTSRDGNKLLKR